MNAVCLALFASLALAATTLEGRWEPCPGNLWLQVKRALELPDYRDLVRLNDLPNTEYVNLSSTYTVPYVPTPVPPAAWGVTRGLPHLALNIPTGRPMATPSLSGGDATSISDGSRLVETYYSSPSPSDCSSGVNDPHAQETPGSEDSTVDQRPEEYKSSTGDEQSSDTGDFTSTRDQTTTLTTNQPTDDSREATATARDTSSTTAADTKSTEAWKPEGGFVSRVTQYALYRGPACYLQSEQVATEELSSHIQRFCESTNTEGLNPTDNLLYDKFKTESGGLHVFSFSWVPGCLGQPEKLPRDECVSTFESINERCGKQYGGGGHEQRRCLVLDFWPLAGA